MLVSSLPVGVPDGDRLGTVYGDESTWWPIKLGADEFGINTWRRGESDAAADESARVRRALHVSVSKMHSLRHTFGAIPVRAGAIRVRIHIPLLSNWGSSMADIPSQCGISTLE